MTRAAPILALALLAGACDCGDTGISGSPDAWDAIPDTAEEPDTTDEPDPSCPDDDEDGYRDESCGGADCDDGDPSIHPGAPEVCLDGVDQDCDTIVDGLAFVEPPAIVVADSLDPAGSALAWSGSEFGLAWVTLGGGLHFTRISPLGEPVEEHSTVCETDSMMDAPRIVWTGSEYGVTWSDMRTSLPEIHLARIDAAGSPVTDDIRLTHDPWVSQNSSIAWTGSEFGLAWMDTRVGESGCTMTSCLVDGFFMRASALGEKIGTDLRISDETLMTATPGLAWIFWTGDGFGAFWWNHLTRLSPDGVETGPEVDLDTDEFIAPVWTGSEYGVLWHSHSSESPGLHLTRLAPDGAETAVSEIVDTLNVSEYTLSWTGSEYGVARQEHGVPDPCVMFDVVRPDGTMPHETLGVAGCSSYLDHTHAPHVWTGSEFGLVWRTFGEGLLLGRIGFCD